jgi:biotin transporter BioY
MKVIMKKHILTLTFALLAVGLYAQPGNPSNPVPLDAGISILIAAGAAYGAKKVNDLRKRG